MEQCFNDPQSQLAEAAHSKDIKKFRQALIAGGDADILDKNGLTLFEWICGQSESAAFISECIKNGSPLQKANEKLDKYPIHFACESLDSGNVEAVANSMVHQGLDLNVKYYGQTALVQVVSKITKENCNKCCEITKVLVKNGADVNIPDGKDQTPVLLLLKKITSGDEVKNTIKFILSNCVVDLDTFRAGEARKKLKEKCPDFEALVRDGTELSVQLLESHLKNSREQAFINDLPKVLTLKGTNNVDDLVTGGPTLLETAVNEGLTMATKELLARNVNVNRYINGTMSPVKVAAQKGNKDMLDALLSRPEIILSDSDKNPILCTIVQKLSEDDEKSRENYKACFEKILSHPGVDVNESDKTDNTALHYACRYRNSDAILALLDKKAYIGIQNALESIAIDDIDADVLEQHFDNCITTNHSRIGDDDYEIQLDFSNFSPVKPTKGVQELHGEIAPLMVIAKTKELKHLMTHPLITSFLFIKWHRLFSLFLLNLILYSIFCISLVVYVVFFYGSSENKRLASVFILLTTIGLLLVVVRELSQFILSPMKYIKLFENYLEVALICMTIAVLVTNYEGEYSTRTRVFASITILLAAAELTLLISSLPNAFISTHIVMIKRVSRSFMKSLSINAVIILAFAFCFYTLFNDGATSATGDDENNFNKFVSPGTAIIKTIVMMTGEFEAANIDFNVSQTSYFIFLIFVFGMSIVLFNLLNGLAVSDTQQIKAEAEQCHFIEKASTLYRFEKSFLSKDFSFLPRLKDSYLLKSGLTKLICVFPHFLPEKKIVIYPNASGRIKVPKLLSSAADYNGTDTCILLDRTYEKLDLSSTNKICLCQPCVGHCSRMDRKIVKRLMQCIERRRRAEEEDTEKKLLQTKVSSIEKKLVQQEALLAEILELLKNKQ